jgi:DNA-binding response OmpR family regulator
MVKILVVDDEMDVCDFTKSFFEQRGFEVFTAADGDAALSVVETIRPDIVLLDIRMKGMDGMEVLRHIKEMVPSMIVIMVTAVDDAEKMKEATNLGAKDYVTKPLILEELEKKVVSIASRLG